MNANPQNYEDIYDALRDVVRALGGAKAVGPMLWPTKPPREARTYLNDCLNRERREKLDPEQLIFLLRKSRDVGCHAGANFIADATGYERARPKTRQEERREAESSLANLMREVHRAVARLEDLGLSDD